MPGNLVKNAGFEADWGSERSHRCLILPEDAQPFDKDVGNIFTPPDWITWYHHKPGTWDQPEVRDAWKQNDPHRVHGGQKGMLLFTFFRGHDAGFLQRVQVTAGDRLRLTAWAHAWSNTKIVGHEDCYGNARCSAGVGPGPAFVLEGDAPEPSGDPWADAVRNFTFFVGIDPTGATNPLGDTVIWGGGAHIYNVHAPLPPVEAVAASDTVTIFLRSRAVWPFRHNDAYWDDVELIAVGSGGDLPPEAHVGYRPAHPQVGDAMTIEARSSVALTRVGLAVTQPSGDALSVGDVSVGRDGAWHTWTFRTEPVTQVGEHRGVFTADDGVQVMVALDCAPEVRLSYHPLDPKVGDRLTVEARSVKGLTNVELAITRPAGTALDAGAVDVGRDGDWHTWTYTTVPADEVGIHTVVFAADGGVEVAVAFDCAPVVRLGYAPAAPRVGDPVTIEARSLGELDDVDVVVTQPSGAELSALGVVPGHDAAWHTWTSETLPTHEPGAHTISLSAAGGVAAERAFECEPALEPAVGRGLPRKQYRRTYVLLPPDADARWALVAVGGTWDLHQYTVGGSADDAGIGDLDARRVIAVNPERWPTDLEAFFAAHYPGVQYVAVEAGTPDDLARELERL